MPAGRPTKYNQGMVDAAQEYLDGGYLSGGKVIPSTVGLALHLNITRTTVDDWGNDPEKEDFSYILKQIQAKQQELFLNSGLTGDFNSTITKLVLGKHGYSDKIDSDSRHNISFSGMTDEQLQAIVAGEQ